MPNPHDYPRCPNGLARLCEDKIVEWEAQLATAKTSAEPSPIK